MHKWRFRNLHQRRNSFRKQMKAKFKKRWNQSKKFVTVHKASQLFDLLPDIVLVEGLPFVGDGGSHTTLKRRHLGGYWTTCDEVQRLNTYGTIFMQIQSARRCSKVLKFAGGPLWNRQTMGASSHWLNRTTSVWGKTRWERYLENGGKCKVKLQTLEGEHWNFFGWSTVLHCVLLERWFAF